LGPLSIKNYYTCQDGFVSTGTTVLKRVHTTKTTMSCEATAINTFSINNYAKMK